MNALERKNPNEANEACRQAMRDLLYCKDSQSAATDAEL
jgi:hypothetical protein